MSDDTQRIAAGLLAAALCALVLLAAGSAAAAEAAARVTAVAGDTRASGVALVGAAVIGEDSSIETGADGNAAVLVDEDSLVELCSQTVMSLTRDDTGTRVIEVDAGTTRIVVEPRLADEQIQIHTPAAIATILGTVVYVTVDSATGETTIASEDNDVKVESRDPGVAGSTTITGSEQVTILPGEAPSEPRKLHQTALSNLGGCLMDLHGVALGLGRTAVGNSAGDRLADTDGGVAELPFVGPGPPPFPHVPGLGPPEDPTSPPDDPTEPPATPGGRLDEPPVDPDCHTNPRAC